jgi:hypothetical protein
MWPGEKQNQPQPGTACFYKSPALLLHHDKSG